MKSTSIKMRITLALVMLLSLLAATIAGREIQITQQRQRQANEKLFQDIEDHYELSLRQSLNFLTLTVETIARSPEVASAFSNFDRTALLDRYGEYFQELHSQYGIEQFQFHLPNSYSFLRLHKPEKYGDDLSAFRATVVEANQNRRLVRGLEVGRAGPGLRVVAPLRHNYQHIGTVEFGGSIDALLQTLQETFDVDYAVGIHQDVFEKARRLEASADDIILGETVYYSFSTPETQALTASLADQQELPKRWTYERRRFFLHALPITDFSGNTVGTLLISVDRTEASAALAREIRLIVLGSILILVVAISVLFAILGQAFAPIRAIIATTDKVAQGNFDITLDHQRSDEIGAIQQGLAQILRQLCPAIGQVKVNAGEIQQAGHQLSHAANQLAAGVTEQATNAETISSSLTAISVTVSENTAHSARTAAIAERASTDVTKVSEAVLGTRDVIHQIQTKITNIDYIARNTHLLAINASIEASAAGSDGKGFGVIAKDVRRLAQQVQDMAKEIEQLVHQSVNEADESARRLNQLAPNLVESNRLIAEVYEASQQQDDEVRQIMQAMTQLETVIQQNAANSEQLTAMAARFCNRAEALQSAVDYFHIGQTQSIKPAV